LEALPFHAREHGKHHATNACFARPAMREMPDEDVRDRLVGVELVAQDPRAKQWSDPSDQRRDAHRASATSIVAAATGQFQPRTLTTQSLCHRAADRVGRGLDHLAVETRPQGTRTLCGAPRMLSSCQLVERCVRCLIERRERRRRDHRGRTVAARVRGARAVGPLGGGRDPRQQYSRTRPTTSLSPASRHGDRRAIPLLAADGPSAR